MATETDACFRPADISDDFPSYSDQNFTNLTNVIPEQLTRGNVPVSCESVSIQEEEREEMFDETQEDDNPSPDTIEEDSAFTEEILDMLVSVPQDTFISEILLLCDQDEEKLNDLRHVLLTNCKQNTDFPYPNAVLKTRRESRAGKGETLKKKLSRDCFHLFHASRGDYHEHLHAIFNISRKSMTQTKTHENKDSELFSQLSITETIATLTRDLSTLRGEYIQDNENLQGAVKRLENDLLDTKKTIRVMKQDITTKDKAIEVLKRSLEQSVKLFENDLTTLKDTVRRAGVTQDVSEELLQHDRIVHELNSVNDSILDSISDMKSDITQVETKTEANRNTISRIADDRDNGLTSLHFNINTLKQTTTNMEDDMYTILCRIEDLTSSTNRWSTRISSIEKSMQSVNEDLKKKSTPTLIQKSMQSVNEDPKKSTPTPVNMVPTTNSSGIPSLTYAEITM